MVKIIETQVGPAKIWQLIEAEIGPDVDIIFEQETLDAAAKVPWLAETYITEAGKLRGNSQSYIIRIGARIIVNDTCIGNDKPRPDFPQWGNLATAYLDGLARLGVQPGDVTDVLYTHLHPDWTCPGFVPVF